MFLSQAETLTEANLLLASLSSEDRTRLAPLLERIELRGGDRIASSQAPVIRICFPETVVATFGEVIDENSRFAVGMIGREGMIGWPTLLGASRSAHSGQVQLSGGTALVLPASDLARLCEESRTLHVALLRFVQSFTVQMGRTIVANLRDSIERRLARWLLMFHDRIAGDEFAVTHDALGAALNIRRASVTDALHLLEGERALRCTRGRITVRDRAALQRLAGDSYGPAETSYRELIGPFGKS